MENRRLFFAAQVEAAWPHEMPPGRILEEKARHITVAFLGNGQFENLEAQLASFPSPPFVIGPVAIADHLLFLPEQSPRVVAASIAWLNGFDSFLNWRQEIVRWLAALGYSTDQRPFFPHITLARSPFDQQQWAEASLPLPIFIRAIHLYQSMGNLHYQSLWEFPLLLPFEELEHTADVAFLIRGSNCKQLHLNAQIAMSFKCPNLIPYFSTALQDDLDEVIIDLNRMIAQCDSREGSPFKAVSFHGKTEQTTDKILTWEMIIDV